MRGVGVAAGLALAVVTCPGAVRAQQLPTWLRGYYLNFATAQAEGDFSSAAVSDVQRLRFMADHTAGMLSFDVAYEHVLSLTSDASSGSVLGVFVSPIEGDWLDLDWTLSDSDHANWVHRFDRINVTARLGESVELSAGRQPISWATTLVLTPADPFTPFNPSDPFREYRGGVDALRAQAFLGPFSGADVVVRPADGPDSTTTITAAGRVYGSWRGWDLQGWGGVIHDRFAFSAGLTRNVAGATVRSEVVLRDEPTGSAWRMAAGVHHRFGVAGRDLVLAVEYQHDDFGAADASEIIAVAGSPAGLRGELQVLGRDAAVIQATYIINTVLAVDLFTLWNLGDPSTLFGAGGTYSLSNELGLRLGTYWGAGKGFDVMTGPGSEFGLLPFVGYMSLTGFF
jgi:hypothetical protein